MKSCTSCFLTSSTFLQFYQFHIFIVTLSFYKTHKQSSLFIDTTQHYYCVKISNILLVMPNNTLFKMFFKTLFTCFFITWNLATCSIVSRWRDWSLCKLFHSYYESLFMTPCMINKQNAVVVWPAILSKLGNHPV